jgi:DNA segregation ATPase FtsK/SpoIIIE, S-DNA-T family
LPSTSSSLSATPTAAYVLISSDAEHQGWATAGYDASDETLISPLARGVSLLRAEDGKPRRIKTAYLTDDQIAHLAAYAAQLRGKQVA